MMKRLSTALTSGIVMALTMGTGQAMAAPVDTLTTNPDIPAPQAQATPYGSRIVVTSLAGDQVIDLTQATQTVGEALASRDLVPTEYRQEGNLPLDSMATVPSGTNLVLYRSEVSGASTTVALPAPEETRETADLFVGETKVENPGEAGEALKTVISTKNLANQDAAAQESTEEKLTILKAPVPKVTLVGTKVKPKPVQAQAKATTSTQDSGNRAPVANEVNNTASNASSRASSSSARIKDNWGRSTPEDKAALKAATVDNATIQLFIDQVGKDYVWAAAGPNSFDCSGLVYWVYHTNNGKNIPRTAKAIGMYSQPVAPANIQPGDVVWTSSHIGVYVGDGKVVHAANPRRGVVITDLDWFLRNGFKVGRV